jgi:hypothetical protein
MIEIAEWLCIPAPIEHSFRHCVNADFGFT